VTWQGQYFQVFMFAEEQHAEVFSKEFGGERMHPSEKGKGKRWGDLEEGHPQAESVGLDPKILCAPQRD
jgi:hypothetical protein